MYKLVYYICINKYKSIFRISRISTFQYTRESSVKVSVSINRFTLSSTIYNARIKRSLRIGILICFDKGSKL